MWLQVYSYLKMLILTEKTDLTNLKKFNQNDGNNNKTNQASILMNGK